MKKAIRLLSLCICVLALTLSGSPARAADVSVSSASCTVGDSVSVTLSIGKQATALEILLSFDSGVLSYTGCSGGLGAVMASAQGSNMIKIVDYTTDGSVKSASYTLSFKSKNTGNASVSVSEILASGKDGKEISLSYGGVKGSVTVKAKPTASSEARLSALTIKPGNLSPAFSPDVYEYKMSVGAWDSSLTLNYSVKDGNAKAVYWPYLTELPVGTTDFYVRVTAQDGKTQKDYHVAITRPQPETQPPTQAPTQPPTQPQPTQPPVTEPVTQPVTEEVTTEPAPSTVVYDSARISLLVLEIPEELEIPAGYERTAMLSEEGVVYEVLVPAGEEEHGHYLIYGEQEEGEPGLYLFDEEQKTLQRYGLALPAQEETAEPETTEEPSTAEPETTTAVPETAESSESPTAETAAPSTEPEPSATERFTLFGDLKGTLGLPRWAAVLALALLLICLLVIVLLALAKRRMKHSLQASERLSSDEEEVFLGISDSELYRQLKARETVPPEPQESGSDSDKPEA